MEKTTLKRLKTKTNPLKARKKPLKHDEKPEKNTQISVKTGKKRPISRFPHDAFAPFCSFGDSKVPVPVPVETAVWKIFQVGWAFFLLGDDVDVVFFNQMSQFVVSLNTSFFS